MAESKVLCNGLNLNLEHLLRSLVRVFQDPKLGECGEL